MEIKLTNVRFLFRKRLLNIIVRTFIFLMCTSVFCFNTENTFLQEKVIIQKDQLVTVDYVFKIIKKQTELNFVYPKGIFKDTPKIQLKKGGIEASILINKVLEKSNFNFRLSENNTIIINEVKVEKVDVQDFMISGTIIDNNGQPLPGANILERGTSNGAQSDFDGNFSLKVKDANAIIVVSYLGFVTQEIPLNGKSTLTVVLIEDSAILDEVVVIGYGVKRKADLTGAVSSIKAETFEEQPITTLEQGMQGRMSGVQVVQSSAQPGAGTSIRIRGVASLAGSSEPLFVIDGIPQFNANVGEANGLSNIDPSNIASIEVLKDAASTAIYGSRAANGVVLITTKTGKTGDPVLRFSSNLTLQSVRKKLDLMSGQQYIDFVSDYYDNSIADGDLTQADKNQVFSEIQNTSIANTDWQDELYRTALRQSYNFSVSGGSDKSKYFVSTSYLDQEGIVKDTDFQRLALRVNLENKISDRINLSTRLSGSRTFQNRFVGNDGTNDTVDGKNGIGSILNAEPSIAPFDVDGNIADVRAYSFSAVNNQNPFGYLEATDQRESYRFQANVELKVDILKGLSNTVRLGATYDNSNTGIYLPSSLVITPQQAQYATLKNLNVLVEDFVTFNKQINDNINLNLIGGVAYQKESSDSFMISGQGLPDDNLGVKALQALETVSPPQTNNIEQTLISLFARANINIKGRYLLNASVRRDGASQFAEGNKHATFPAASAGWRISEEEFISDQSALSNLKLRVSWGQSGNQAIQPYQSLTIGNSVNTPQGSGTGLNSGLAPNLPNKNLTWETSTQTNLGLDFGFTDDKYRLSFDWYTKTTEDLLSNILLPLSSGFSSIISNVGEIRNRGYEISAGIDIPVSDDLQFFIDANFSSNNNEVIKTKDGEDIITGGSNDASKTSLIVREGESISSFYMIKFIGLDANGIPQYEDFDANGTIDDADRQIVGSSLPDFVYGINLTANYKKLSLVMNWQGASGLTLYNEKSNGLFAGFPGSNKRADLSDLTPRPSVMVGRALRTSDRYLEDASYLRLKNIKLNYAIPTDNLKGISNFDIYVSAQNLITLTDYSGYDPEVSGFNGGDLRQGVDLSTYPGVKSITFGLNVSF